MNASELIEAIDSEVMDETLTQDRTLPLLNQAQRAISQAINFPHLITKYSITTIPNEPEVTLPENFQKNLFQAYVDSRELDVLNSRDDLFSEYGAFNKIGIGSMYAVAVEGRNLCYALIPTSAMEVEIWYYKYPEDMQDSPGSYPDLITNSVDIDDALMFWVKWKYFQQIEQGIEGQKTDTAYNLNEYRAALGRIKLSVREGVSLPPPPKVEQPW